MQYNKVEISGINTDDLIVLKESEKRKLLIQMKEGDKQARKKLIEGNLRLVLSVIKRFTGRGESADDLFQIGVIGLMKAIDNFDTDLDVRFSTYAVPMVTGEVKRFLRDTKPLRVSRSMRDLAYKAMQAKEKLTNKYKREPNIDEIAKTIDVQREDVVIALESVNEPISLYEPVYSDSGDTLYVLDQVSDDNDTSDWIDELLIKEVIKNLDKREKRILQLRFFQGKTQVEVAEDIGVSQAQVSRIEKRVLDKVKGSIF